MPIPAQTAQLNGNTRASISLKNHVRYGEIWHGAGQISEGYRQEMWNALSAIFQEKKQKK